ncbi:MAG: hypothetical protein ACRDV9_13625 [Acidimicrobiia bacterium]
MSPVGTPADANVPAVDQAESTGKAREEAWRGYVRGEVYPYSPHYRLLLENLGLDVKRLDRKGALDTVSPTRWEEVASEPMSFVLRPTERAITKFGDRKMVTAVAKAKLRGRVAQLNRDVIDPAYKPVHWHLVEGVPIGYSSEDLTHLEGVGSRLFELAGVGRQDVLVNLTPPGPELSYWQVVLGARAASVPSLHLGPEAGLEDVDSAGPTALAGRTGDLLGLLRLLESKGRLLPGLRTVLVAGEVPDEATRDALATVGRYVGSDDLEVVVLWAPRGARALWAQCRGGRELHTNPDLEWVEVAQPDPAIQGSGELLWSSVSWRGTAFLRLSTGSIGSVSQGACQNCGRPGPKVAVEASEVRPSEVRSSEKTGPTPPTLRKRAEVPAAPQLSPVDRPARPAVAPATDPAAPAWIPLRPPVPTSASSPPAAKEAPALPANGGETGSRVPASTGARGSGRAWPCAPSTVDDWVEVLADLAGHPGIVCWQIECRRSGAGDELLVFLAPKEATNIAETCRALDAGLGATQYVLVPPEDLRRRVASTGLILDLRLPAASG